MLQFLAGVFTILAIRPTDPRDSARAASQAAARETRERREALDQEWAAHLAWLQEHRGKRP